MIQRVNEWQKIQARIEEVLEEEDVTALINVFFVLE